METKFDAKIQKIEELYYFPWIGDDFNNSETKLFVIGESIYIDADGYGEDKDWIQILVKQNFSPIIQGVLIYRLLDNFSKAFYNKSKVSQIERDKLASYMAFTDIVQRPLPDINERPTDEDYENGWSVIISIIKIIKPKNIIILGVESIKHMKKLVDKIDFKIHDFTIDKNTINGVEPRSFSMEIDNEKIKCIAIKHSSKHFSWDTWYNYINQKMDLKEIQIN